MTKARLDPAQLASQVLRIEAAAIARMAEELPDRFEDAVKLILNQKGRAILSGMGKSGHVARNTTAAGQSPP